MLAAPEALTPDRVAQLAECLNVVVLPLLQSPELTPDVCHAARALKAKQMLYMLTVLVDDTCAEEALQDDWMESVAQAVSYTHLDVYKRQRPHCTRQRRGRSPPLKPKAVFVP